MEVGLTRCLGVLVLATATMASPAAAQSTPSFETVILTSHNNARAKVGSVPMVWDANLARAAAVWAQNLARSNRFQHDPNNPDGENLWIGTKGMFPADQMVNAWIAESQFFKPGIFPNVSTTGNWYSVGHYSQMIWNSSTRLGCALASSAASDVLVCRYSPSGNISGRNPLAPAGANANAAPPATPLPPRKSPTRPGQVTPTPVRVTATPIVDPACLAPVPWMVQPDSSTLRLFGCRPFNLIGAYDAQGWYRYDKPDGGFIKVHKDVVWDAAKRSISFRMLVNGGGSGTFAFNVSGGPVRDQRLAPGSFTVGNGN